MYIGKESETNTLGEDSLKDDICFVLPENINCLQVLAPTVC